MLLAALLAVEAPIAEGEVRGVVDKWLAAQNAGDFAAYDKLFAARFTGIRRSGPRTVRFDRAGWMRDRGRMFKKPMTVGISDVKMRIAGSTAVVTFTQTFAQGSFKDAGPKQLVIVRDAGALRISSEKMLRSRIDQPPIPADERFRFAVAGRLLLSESPDEAWAAGPPTYDGGDPVVAERLVDAAKLPPELARWRGRRVRLATAGGASCDGKVSGFRLLSRSIPHFGTRQDWNETKGAEVAQQAWKLGAKVLVAVLDKPCEQAFWGQPAAQTEPRTDTGEAADAALTARAVAQLRRTDAWKQIQKSYLEFEPRPPGGKLWDQADAANVAVQRFRARLGGKEIKLVSVTEWVVAGCGEFNADLWGLFEERSGKLIPRNTPGQTSAKPVAAVDSDGDGNSELLYEPGPYNFGSEKGRLLLQGELWDTTEEVQVPFLDCPC